MLKKIFRRSLDTQGSEGSRTTTSFSDSRDRRSPSSASKPQDRCFPSTEALDRCSRSPSLEPPDDNAEEEPPDDNAEDDKLPDCLVRSKNYSYSNGREGVYIYERRVSFQRGPEVNVMREEGGEGEELERGGGEGGEENGWEEGGGGGEEEEKEDLYRRKRVKPTLLSQAVRSDLVLCDEQKDVVSSAENTDEKRSKAKCTGSELEGDGDEERTQCPVKSECTSLNKLANHNTEHRSRDVSPPITNNKLATELETSDRLISRKMELCHKAQLIECQELCSLYETVSLLDVQMSHCKELLTQAMACEDKEESMKCKENLLGLHFKMMTVQFHVKLHKEFLAIKEKSFQDLLSAKSCIKDTTALIACLTSSMGDMRIHSGPHDRSLTLLNTNSPQNRSLDPPPPVPLAEFGESNNAPLFKEYTIKSTEGTENKIKLSRHETPIAPNNPGHLNWYYSTGGVQKKKGLSRQGGVRNRRRGNGMLESSGFIDRQHTPDCLARPLGG